MRSPSRDSRTQPVPSMAAWADGAARTANTTSGTASIVMDAMTRSVSIPARLLGGLELIAAHDARSEPLRLRLETRRGPKRAFGKSHRDAVPK